VTAAPIALGATINVNPEYGVQSAAVLIAALPTLAVYFFTGRNFLAGPTADAMK